MMMGVLAALLVFLCALGGMAQLQFVQLVQVLGRRYSLITAAVLSALASAALHGWAGQWLGCIVPEQWHYPVISFVLLVAAVRFFVKPKLRAPEEPTYSLGAITLVLFMRQNADPARLVIMAAAMGTLPFHLAVGAGAAGGVAAFAITWFRTQPQE